MYKNWFTEFVENGKELHGIITSNAKCKDERAARKYYETRRPAAQIKRVVEFESLSVMQKAQAQFNRQAKKRGRQRR